MTANPKKARSLRETFGLNLKLERARSNLSQEGLADLVKSDQGYISQIERGAVSPTLDVVERLAAALKVRAVDLLDESLGRPKASS